MYDFKNFGKRIEVFRKAKGMTQDYLAERLGITAQAVSKWENALSYPDITLLPVICSIFDIELDELFGKIKKNESDTYIFPDEYEGLKFVSAWLNIGCYSNKEVEKIDGSGIKFNDGSTAELSNDYVVNRGRGEIKLVIMEEKPQNKALKGEPTQTEAAFEFGKADNIDINIRIGDFTIEKAENDRTTVELNGTPEFIDIMIAEYTDNKLIVRYDKNKKYELKNHGEKNKGIIKLACNTGNTFAANIDGSGSIKNTIPFNQGGLKINGSGNLNTVGLDTADMHINGSGNMYCTEITGDSLRIKINGSGDIEIGNIVNEHNASVGASINGSGNIKIKNGKSINLFDIKINGSGDVCQEHGAVEIIKTGINGTGDLIIPEVTKMFECRINGSGDVLLKGGNAEVFKSEINGSGNINAKCVTAQSADMTIKGSGDTVLGKVTKTAKCLIDNSGTINILDGEAETFEATVGGSGEVRAEGVTARKATLTVKENNGKIILGRVIEESAEKARKAECIKVLHRGE